MVLLACDTTYCKRRIVTGSTLWDMSGAAAAIMSVLCWPEAQGNAMVHTRAVLALALLLCLIIYLGYCWPHTQCLQCL